MAMDLVFDIPPEPLPVVKAGRIPRDMYDEIQMQKDYAPPTAADLNPSLR